MDLALSPCHRCCSCSVVGNLPVSSPISMSPLSLLSRTCDCSCCSCSTLLQASARCRQSQGSRQAVKVRSRLGPAPNKASQCGEAVSARRSMVALWERGDSSPRNTNQWMRAN